MPTVVVALRLLSELVLAGAALSACSQKRDGDPLVLKAKADTARMEDAFGKGFGEAFRADPNSEPRNVTESDVKPVSLTAEPVPIE